jgi:hypothetical protein
VLKDIDPCVRIAICQGLGNLKAKNKPIVERLLRSMADTQEQEAVREAAYHALCSIFEINPAADGSPDKDKLFAGQTKDQRAAAVTAWATFVNGQNLQD